MNKWIRSWPFANTVLLAGLFCCGSAWAQSAGVIAPPARTQTPTPLAVPALTLPNNVQPDLIVPAAPDNYIIGGNDLLSVFVYQMPELTRQVRVSSTGRFRLPFLNYFFQATGKTAPQLQQAIVTALVHDGVAHDPIVQVIVRQVESKPVIVVGAVRYPVTLQAARPMRLLEVLSRAGGLSHDAGSTVLVVESHSGQPQTVESFNLARLMQSGSPQDNPWLTGNDTVTVLPARLIYVVGDFNHPGAFPLRIGHSISIINAIALAQGTGKYPDTGNAFLIRTDKTGVHTQIPIHVNRILRHQAPDLQLQAGDILYIPVDGKKRVLVAALQDVAQTVSFFVGYHL